MAREPSPPLTNGAGRCRLRSHGLPAQAARARRRPWRAAARDGQRQAGRSQGMAPACRVHPGLDSRAISHRSVGRMARRVPAQGEATKRYRLGPRPGVGNEAGIQCALLRRHHSAGRDQLGFADRRLDRRRPSVIQWGHGLGAGPTSGHVTEEQKGIVSVEREFRGIQVSGISMRSTSGGSG